MKNVAMQTERLGDVAVDSVVAVLGVCGAHDDQVQPVSTDGRQVQLVGRVKHAAVSKNHCTHAARQHPSINHRRWTRATRCLTCRVTGQLADSATRG